MRSIFFLVILTLSLTACGSKASAPTVQTLRPALTRLVSVSGHTGDFRYSGEIRSRHEVNLGFRIGGKLIERRVVAGSVVKAGQVLARLDATDTSLQVNSAQAQYQLAKSAAERYRELRSKGFVSQGVLDAKEASLAAALTQAGLTSNQSGYTILRAEHDGVIAATLVEEGQVLSSGQAVLRFAQADEFEVAIEIPESDFSLRHVGDIASIEFLTGEGESLVGRLRELSLSADPVSRTYAARVSFSPKRGRVALGMTARVCFDKGEPSSSELIIPLTAVYQKGTQAAVWVVTADHRVNLRPVEVAAYREEGAVIVRGLAAGERIVSAGVHRLSAGEQIQLVESAQ